MKPTVGFGALGPGAISITVEVADDRICSIRVTSSRPTHLTRLFIGRSAAEIPMLAERLYSLCGFSHAVAATRAIATARGEIGATRCARGEIIGLLCERVSESLRSSATSGGDIGDVFAPDPRIAPTLRRVFSLTRELMSVATSSPSPDVSKKTAMKRLAEDIRAAVSELGVSFSHDANIAPPKAKSWCGKLWSEMENDRNFAASVPDALEPEDDDAILTGLRANSEGFAALPSLVGRTAETGAFARHWRAVELTGGALRARFHARMIDLAQSTARLAQAAADDLDDSSDVRSLALASREGFVAVETTRGALYHWARLSAEDKVQDYAIVAPTEWNFHPAGPFVAAALGARAPQGSAQNSISRLAALFDPCVALRLDVLESVDA
jgi:hypothetical protein